MADDRLFDDLLKQHGAEELAQSHVFPVILDAKEERETNASLQETLSLKRSLITSEDELRLSLMQLRFQIEDYVNEDYYDPKKSVFFS